MGTFLLVAVLLAIVVGLTVSGGRARKIANAKGAAARSCTERDKAYVFDLYREVQDSEFGLFRIQGRSLSHQAMKRFDVKSGRLDDVTVLGKRLPSLGLLESKKSGRYRLTDAGTDLGRRLTDGFKE